MSKTKTASRAKEPESVRLTMTAVKALAEIARKGVSGVSSGPQAEAMLQHVKSFETYMKLTAEAIGIYFFVTAATYTAFFANYRYEKESAKFVLLLPLVLSGAFLLIFLVGLVKWCAKRKGYKEYIRKSSLDQFPDTEMLTLVLLIATSLCVAVAGVTFQMLRQL
jgi:H+/Cl- antiporter ClcA